MARCEVQAILWHNGPERSGKLSLWKEMRSFGTVIIGHRQKLGEQILEEVRIFWHCQKLYRGKSGRGQEYVPLQAKKTPCMEKKSFPRRVVGNGPI